MAESERRLEDRAGCDPRGARLFHADPRDGHRSRTARSHRGRGFWASRHPGLSALGGAQTVIRRYPFTLAWFFVALSLGALWQWLG